MSTSDFDRLLDQLAAAGLGAVGMAILLVIAVTTRDAHAQAAPMEEPIAYSFGTPALEFRPDGDVRYAGHSLFIDVLVYEDVRTFMRRAVHRADGRHARWDALTSIDETCPAVRIVRENCRGGDAETCRGRVEFVLFPAQERPVLTVANDPPRLLFGDGADARLVIVWWARRAAGCRRLRTILARAQ